MLKIPLPDDYETLIDDADALLIAGFPWRVLFKGRSSNYVHAWNGNQHVYMHRLIAGAGPKQLVDHWNSDGLDNRRNNLRTASPSQNLANQRPQRGRTSQYKGVYWDKARQRWTATIHINGKTRSLGRHKTEDAAARAYDHAATEAWGRFARLNFPAEAMVICGLHGLAITDAPCACQRK